MTTESNKKFSEIDQIKGELDSINITLKEHSGLISELQDSTKRLEGGQERQNMAITELSTNFGQVLRELGIISFEFRKGKEETLSAIRNVENHVLKLDADNKAQNTVCNERHKHIDEKIKNIDRSNRRAQKEIDEMSDHSKVVYISNLQEQLDAYQEKEKRIEENKRDVRKDRNKIIIATITALLGGTGGTVLIQWILERMQ